MEYSNLKEEKILKVITCFLPQGQEVLLLANNKRILSYKRNPNSTWEPVTPFTKEVLVEMLGKREKVTQRELVI